MNRRCPAAAIGRGRGSRVRPSQKLARQRVSGTLICETASWDCRDRDFAGGWLRDAACRKTNGFGTAAFAVSTEHRCLASPRTLPHTRTACGPCRVVVRLMPRLLGCSRSESAQVDVTQAQGPVSVGGLAWPHVRRDVPGRERVCRVRWLTDVPAPVARRSPVSRSWAEFAACSGRSGVGTRATMSLGRDPAGANSIYHAAQKLTGTHTNIKNYVDVRASGRSQGRLSRWQRSEKSL